MSYVTDSTKEWRTTANIRLKGACKDCPQAIWQEIAYVPIQDDESQAAIDALRALPPAYGELSARQGEKVSTTENGESRMLSCFCQLQHRFISYCVMKCDGHVPGEAPKLKAFLEDR